MRGLGFTLGLGFTVMAGGHLVSGEAAELTKIRIAPDGRTFRDAEGRPYSPMGVNYYRPGTGWAPQVWKQFDAEATSRDFARMKSVGVNCVRVFLTYGSFYTARGKLREEGLAKFDQFLGIAERAGIYVHPTGPDHWEGPPSWGHPAIEDTEAVGALEEFWRLLAARYRGRNVLFAYDLKNEPELKWESPTLTRRWNEWLHQRYPNAKAMEQALGRVVAPGEAAPPSDQLGPKHPELLAYQDFRESVADEWTRRQVQAIKSADPDALVTVGLIQWSVPVQLPGGVRHYSAFRPERQATWLDFLEIHFYPLANGAYEYRSPEEEWANLAYVESLVRETARWGKPVVLAEFGWYGGGKPRFDGGRHPHATEEQQARYGRRVMEVTRGFVCGWLNWGFYDQPEATDCSELTGLLTADGRMKAWGKTFQDLSQRWSREATPPPPAGQRPELDWPALLTSTEAAAQFRSDYLKRFTTDPNRQLWLQE